ncbi:MAG: carbamoyltransferase HypF [Lachnospiraceae bacterium]|nr:carbamoyltransferase HypF [Lachnospiraceae bacterium]
MNVITKQIRVYGIVQGVGFRPTVSRHAAAVGITGSVCNRGPFVEIYAQGSESQVQQFEELLKNQPPKRAAILKIDSHPLEESRKYPEFSIIESAKTTGEIFISPDIAICEECKRELENLADRRFHHPFINCTCCGPRLTILDALPYDRERTSMKEYPMCPECSEEYYSAATRRYDAQPVCCNDCGPRVYILPPGKTDKTAITNRELDAGAAIQNAPAIREARRVIAEGGIAAIKGIGGYHLCCDATAESAVQLLRTRKTRPMKPLAVMMRDMETVERECSFTEAQREILTGHQKPILLLEKKEGGRLAPSIAPDNPKVGVMLPYAPVQLLLFDPGEEDGIQMPDCLVMTSGNVSGAPICRDDRDASEELGYLCDTILSHNRMIRIRADDTVMDFYRDAPYMIRRSRGYAPLPTLSSREMKGCVLAMGGELKNTFCIGVNGLFYPSPYVGDLEDLRTVTALKETIQRFQTLLEVQPEKVICDLHPGYNSTLLAEELGLPVVKIQHHYAHILSCMAENDTTEPVIGLSFDGTGYGEDGTIWGGELLLCDSHGYTREGHIKPFLQIGGDSSSKEGWRIAVSMLYSLLKDKEKTAELAEKLELCDAMTLKMQLVMADRKINSVVSTSAGRLFDGVSAILGIRKASTFEGEASTALQFAAERWVKRQRRENTEKQENRDNTDTIDTKVNKENQLSGGEKDRWSLRVDRAQQQEGSSLVLATDLLVKGLLERRLSGEEPEYLAWLFHRGLADMLIQSCIRIRQEKGVNRVALSGGCFQNLLLLEMVQTGLEKENFTVLTHSLIPPNDGGIGLGQAYYGMMNP